MKNRAIFLSILVFVIFLMQEVGFASLFERITLSEMIEHSELIVEGTITDIKSHWNKKKTMIYTDVIVSIDWVEKGNIQEDFLLIRLLGGRVGDKAVIALGTPMFSIGEKVFLFLNKSNPEFLSFFLGQETTSKLEESYQITGSGQGYFKIIQDSQTGKKILRQNVEEMEFVNQVVEPFDLQNLPLQEIRGLIQQK